MIDMSEHAASFSPPPATLTPDPTLLFLFAQHPKPAVGLKVCKVAAGCAMPRHQGAARALSLIIRLVHHPPVRPTLQLRNTSSQCRWGRKATRQHLQLDSGASLALG